MIYDLFVEFVGGNSEEFIELLENSVNLQKCFAAGAFGLTCFSLVLFCYLIIVIFRGWK